MAAKNASSAGEVYFDMAKKSPKKPKPEEIETEPDAWERFEKTIGKIIPPKRRPANRGEETEKQNDSD